MAVRKRTKKPAPANIAPNKQAMLWYVVVIIAVLVFGLTYLWRHLPSRPKYQVPNTPVVQELNQKQRLTCERAGGKWTDCGNPCHGQDVESCVAMCEPQCLCGGGPSYSCPVNTVCTNKASAKPGEPAIGVCRGKAVTSAPTTQKTVITATVDASSYPYTLTGTVTGTSTALWWTVTDISMTEVGRGTIQWPATSTASFEQKIFLSAMPTSTALSFALVSGNERIELNVTSSKLLPMTRTVYVNDPILGIDACDSILQRKQLLPKTAYPFEAVMRASLGDSLLNLSVVNGVATVVVLNDSSYTHSMCKYPFSLNAAKAVAKDFPSIKDLVITEQNAQTQP